MAITEDGLFVCNRCMGETGEFNGETGNHVLCDEMNAIENKSKTLEVISGNMAEVIEYAVGDATFGRIEKGKKVLKCYEEYKSNK